MVRRSGPGQVLAWARSCGVGGSQESPCLRRRHPHMRRSKKKNSGSDEPRRPRGRRAPIIELNDVTKVYPGGHMALDRVNLSVGRGEFVFLVGPTGCGKSTLIKMLIRELAATEGSVKIAGKDIGKLSEKKIPL